ncbi:hypothetical protein NPIL_215511 [Nephila pilipes]|uniref:Uncharacterized protein n=1 Tax=Nephila pilipes TaxID=299642 RepID=A0A8X6P5W9_NEPPI|nr:hypothetical protein NPIL_215511 [Nephila pilipes]
MSLLGDDGVALVEKQHIFSLYGHTLKAFVKGIHVILFKRAATSFFYTGFKYSHRLPCKLIISSAAEEDEPLELIGNEVHFLHLNPYNAENTALRPIIEVKHHRGVVSI